MPWTLDNALQECARNTYNTKTMVRASGSYTGKGLEYAQRLLSGINYAINKIAREKIGQVKTQDVVLSDQGRFNISSLTGSVLRVNSIKFNGSLLSYDTDVDETAAVPGYASQTVSVQYEIKPEELTMADLDTAMPIDERYIDPRCLCQYANYQFLSELGTDYDTARAQVWLGLFNDSFANIVATNRLTRRVRYNG